MFRTPTLPTGQAFYYMLRAEVVRDGKSYSEDKRVIVRAGDEVVASFKKLEKQASAEVMTTARR
jgi:uncharacterized protein (TIGR03000 family)